MADDILHKKSECIRKYFPGGDLVDRPTPIFIITLTLMKHPYDKPTVIVPQPCRTKHDADMRMDLIRLDILKMVYSTESRDYIIRNEDSLWAEVLRTHYHVAFQVDELTLPGGM